MELLCREAAMKPVRRLMTKLQNDSALSDTTTTAANTSKATSKKGGSVAGTTIADCGAAIEGLLRMDPVTLTDFEEALATTRPSSDYSLSSR